MTPAAFGTLKPQQLHFIYNACTTALKLFFPNQKHFLPNPVDGRHKKQKQSQS